MYLEQLRSVGLIGGMWLPGMLGRYCMWKVCIETARQGWDASVDVVDERKICH